MKNTGTSISVFHVSFLDFIRHENIISLERHRNAVFFNTKQLPPDKYLKLLEKRRAEYRKFTPLFCPCLNEQITFNSDGFNHLRFHLEHKARTQAEQVHKLNFLPHVRTVLIKASKIESYRKINKSEYWALCATIGKGNLKVRVIIRRIGNGKMHFWSVMNVK